MSSAALWRREEMEGNEQKRKNRWVSSSGEAEHYFKKEKGEFFIFIF